MLANSVKLYLVNFVFSLMPLTRWYRCRSSLLKFAGVSCDNSVRIVSSARVVLSNVSIGADTFIGHQVLIAGSSDGNVFIGCYVDIAPRVLILSGSHRIDMDGPRTAGEGIGKNVVIEDGVWIGANSTILPGVKIGKKSIIGAGSVVVHDIPAMSIAVGNPCKPIKRWSTINNRFDLL